jgi:uncharacterized protein YndB with AHSA1/START domain
MTGPATIRRRVSLPATSDRVWEAITDPGRMPDWFGGRVDWELQEGGPLSYRGDDGEARTGRIEEIRPGRRLRFVWWPAEGSGGEPDPGATEVTYLLEPVDDGTVLTVQETPLGAGSLRASGSAADRRRGWDDWDSRLAGAWVNLSAGARTVVRA